MSRDQPQPVDGLEVNVVEDGYVIYQPSSDRVHYLNVTSALVFELCDGTRDAVAIAAELASAYRLDSPPTTEATDCLALLLDQGVLH